MQNKNNAEVVTVAVITYHSSLTVVETLDSIFFQTYGPENIELIISDDGSKDNTVQVIELWLEQHQSRFYNVKFFANKINGGISKNCNVAWKASTSEWIKTIAGDDILVSNALKDLVNCKNINKKSSCFFGLIKKFPSNDKGLLPKKSSFAQKFFNVDSRKQFKMLLIGNVPNAPASFINRKALVRVGYADESFKLLEDYPLWLNLTKNGFKLSLVNSLVVNYRVSESVSMSSINAINFRLNNEIRLCLIKHCRNAGFPMKCLILIDVLTTYINDVIVYYVFFNKRSFLTELFKVLSPLSLLRKSRLFIYWVKNHYMGS